MLEHLLSFTQSDLLNLINVQSFTIYNFSDVSSVWLGAQFIKQAWIWEERATPMKTENDGFPLCQCNDALDNTCLSLGKTGNGKFLLHGLPCDYAQMSVCSDVCKIVHQCLLNCTKIVSDSAAVASSTRIIL